MRMRMRLRLDGAAGDRLDEIIRTLVRLTR
jgi:hypothetical protein